MTEPADDNSLVIACATLVHATGAEGFQIRYSKDDDPIIWIAVATYSGGRAEADAALDPNQAAWRLAERLVDGGTCGRCGKPTALVEGEEDLTGLLAARMPMCQYRYRAGRIRRGCDSMPVGS